MYPWYYSQIVFFFFFFTLIFNFKNSKNVHTFNCFLLWEEKKLLHFCVKRLNLIIINVRFKIPKIPFPFLKKKKKIIRLLFNERFRRKVLYECVSTSNAIN